MILEELEVLIKELREKGASENTEIKFINYAGSYGYDELTYSDIDLYFPETSPNYIEMIFRWIRAYKAF